ncbi:hypothetical protein [Vibrio cholerae]|uniref:Uncharacterized protein n=2 Tax=Vibrio cholerae TaxID=666 RepID=A0ABD7SLQ6_VIBCL|nr:MULTISPECIES: hypothetical protein [Vibrio]EGQ7702370.1 hypothetical protein [Vibrio cholerae]EGQ7789997.1 hypothetical protein [Vibrio cholerae]EGR1703793.1 hypothetical protein [Vibrio cholerae]EGR4140811.1 hypothetical protein [Vibrio cholerae]EJH6266017.1 hypothetical protein [Vibrio cholerae]
MTKSKLALLILAISSPVIATDMAEMNYSLQDEAFIPTGNDFLDDNGASLLEVKYVNAIIPEHDWRDGWPTWQLPKNVVFPYFKPHNTERSFNYWTKDGEAMWFNYKFFDDRKEIFYQIKSSKRGVIQEGYTTLSKTKERYVYYPEMGSEAYQVEMMFDVKFDPSTHMQPYLYVRQERRGLTKQIRGYVRDWEYADVFQSHFAIRSSFY